jgi:hypothetical protein
MSMPAWLNTWHHPNLLTTIISYISSIWDFGFQNFTILVVKFLVLQPTEPRNAEFLNPDAFRKRLASNGTSCRFRVLDFTTSQILMQGFWLFNLRNPDMLNGYLHHLLIKTRHLSSQLSLTLMWILATCHSSPSLRVSYRHATCQPCGSHQEGVPRVARTLATCKFVTSAVETDFF